MTSVENSQVSTFSSNEVDHHPENVDGALEIMDPQLENHGDVEAECEITEEEVRGILEVIAATGKFWHDWDILKSFLSLRLKQVLAEYPEAQMVSDQQTYSLGETYPELVKRLDKALLSFTEGPPFTLQRLCEILLTAKSIYPSLSKLALALEKNLLVTSTLTICMDPFPSATMIPKPDEPDKGSAAPLAHSNPVENGIEDAMVRSKDEKMAETEEMMKKCLKQRRLKKIKTETSGLHQSLEAINGAPETSIEADTSTSSELSGESSALSEQLDSTN